MSYLAPIFAGHPFAFFLFLRLVEQCVEKLYSMRSNALVKSKLANHIGAFQPKDSRRDIPQPQMYHASPIFIYANIGAGPALIFWFLFTHLHPQSVV